MRSSIHQKIVLLLTASLAVVFISLLIYINAYIKPQNTKKVNQQNLQQVESYASEVGMWISRKIGEFRVLSQMPAFKDLDFREIDKLFASLTRSFKVDGGTMETFSYASFNASNGYNWLTSDIPLDLMVYEDYTRLASGDTEYVIGNPVRMADGHEVIVLYYSVWGNTNEYSGILCSAVPTIYLNDIVSRVSFYDGEAWIMSRNGEIIAANSDFACPDEIKAFAATQALSAPGEAMLYDADNKAHTLFYSPIEFSQDWIFCTLVNNGKIAQVTNQMAQELTITCVILLALSVFFGTATARRIVDPIKKLQFNMNRVRAGDLGAYYTPETRDEVYYLGKSYNEMLSQINVLIKRIYEEQDSKRIAEIRVLQSQIKPHFLYNTLDNLKWMAKDYGAQDIADTISSLSTLFRVFLSEGQEMIPLSQEFLHTTSYLEIQSIRYAEKFTCDIYLDDGVGNVLVPKIIIQPLVENAIYHGIKQLDEQGGISVRGERDGAFVRITVKDTGAGMDAALLERLRADMNASSCPGEHFGLYNIQSRLRLTYGEKAGLALESAPGAGTLATIIIPIQEEKPCTERS